MTLLRSVLLAVLFLVSEKTWAHDGFEGRTDPVTKSSCCTSSANATSGDCRVLKVEPGMLEGVPEGYRLRLTEAQVKVINPQRKGGVDTVIPWERIQESWDGQFRVCIPPYPSPTMQADVYCFWAPNSI